jgi:mannose-6-phosphate isomerase
MNTEGSALKTNRTQAIPTTKPPVAFVERPWGSFKQFAHNQNCTVSLMSVLPGQRLSLQSHSGRAELWIVLDDGAVVQVGDEQRVCHAGDEFWISPNQKHRLGSCKNKPVRVLEVAFGNWRQEDINRYADDYHRPDTS